MDLELLCFVGTVAIMLMIIFIGKPEKRFLRLAICTVIIPLCFMALHTSCFFNSVPHCLGCLLVDEGEVKPPYDANDLKSTCFSAYLAVMMVFAPMIIKENVTKGYKGICAILIIAGVVFIGFPLGIMQYM